MFPTETLALAETIFYFGAAGIALIPILVGLVRIINK